MSYRSNAPNRWFTLPVGDTRACVRCGRKRKVRTDRRHDLCGDCIAVTTELGELHLWTGAAA